MKNISVKEIAGKLSCKTADVYWDAMTELAAPVVVTLNKADNKMKR